MKGVRKGGKEGDEGGVRGGDWGRGDIGGAVKVSIFGMELFCVSPLDWREGSRYKGRAGRKGGNLWGLW